MQFNNLRVCLQNPLKFTLLIGFVIVGHFAWAGPKVELPKVKSLNPVASSRISTSLYAGSGILPQAEFCSEWNPDFFFNGYKCCSRYIPGRKFNKTNHCPKARMKRSYCDEMTDQQKEYSEHAANGRLGDLLELIKSETALRGPQSYCSVNNGFLAYGRRLIPTPENRILVKSPNRCLDFGTDSMIGMLEWLGRQVAARYSDAAYQGTKLVIGNISAPRGGCITGLSGKRAHASHTSGLDADIGFLWVKANQPSPLQFPRTLQLEPNWWLIKKILQNPFACVKVIFIDRTHIRTLNQYAKKDPDWPFYQRFIRHLPGHKNHMHVRIGNGPGKPGCVPDPHPELETEEDGELDPYDPEKPDFSWMDDLRQKHKKFTSSSIKG